MIFFLKLPSKCSIKNTTWIIFIISLCVVIHLWIMRDITNLSDNLTSILSVVNRKDIAGSKLILMWNKNNLMWSAGGGLPLTGLNCPLSNCIFTENRYLLGENHTIFDAILFTEANLNNRDDRPLNRTSSQMYIFATVESAYNYPACEVFEDNFYNWTMTYRLDSDVLWYYFVVSDANGVIVAPRREVHWKPTLNTIPPPIKTIISGRTKAAAWFVSNCKADSSRDEYLSRLQDHLFQYSLKIDVFGGCSKVKCKNKECNRMLRNDYYFYMAFENSFSEDYVTEKVLHGFDNYVVPIVYGSANYTRFLPPGSYINARELHPYNLAHIIYQAMRNPQIYESYFRWTNNYMIYWDYKVFHPFCDLCAALNTESATHAPAKKNFRVWWNGLNGMKWCLSKEYWNETSNMNIDGRHIFSLY